MAIASITATCEWCTASETFNGDDPENEWREAGWFLHLVGDEEREYCCLACVIAAQ